MSLTVVILTRDEALHIARAIRSVQEVADRVVVVDSNSTDATAEIARGFGAEVLVHPFVNQSQQFNWALTQLPDDTDWIFRLDADEVVSPELAQALADTLPGLSPEIAGARILRRMAFLGKPIRWGGVFPVSITRVLRYGRGRSEDLWMDEHIVLDGPEVQLKGELLDDNLKPLHWWVDKHNNYASREVVEILNSKYNFLDRTIYHRSPKGRAGIKRWFKTKVYYLLPSGLRAFAYFFYRYVIRLGFLDGREGMAFHILQGFWYRYLVDLKLREVNSRVRLENLDVTSAICDILLVDLTATEPSLISDVGKGGSRSAS